MPGRSIAIAIGGAVTGAVIAGGAVAIAQSDESSVTGATAEKAVAAATDATGGGTANSVERDGENGAVWEVEVAKPDGTTVDVRLDANYKVVTVEGDSESNDADDNAPENPEADAAEDQADGTVNDDATEDAGETDD